MEAHTVARLLALTLAVLLNACLFACVQAATFGPKTDIDWQTWGPYRPNLYFGVRPQLPETLLMGILWASGDDRKRLVETLRHTCEQEDGVRSYGWTSYDPRVGGTQLIRDQELQLHLTTDFLKTDDGQGWAVRVSGVPEPGAPPHIKTSLVFHVALESMAGSQAKSLRCDYLNRGTGHSLALGASCRGRDPKLGDFDLVISTDSRESIIHHTGAKSLNVSEDEIWQPRSAFVDVLQNDDSQHPNKIVPSTAVGGGNLHFMHYTFLGAFSATFRYRQDVNDTRLGELRASFPSRVDRVFPRSHVFRREKYAAFAQALLSNLLGGLGFFHGDSRVATEQPEYEEKEPDFWMPEKAAMDRGSFTVSQPMSLLSFTPSRPGAPRGFLWDEGFHLLPVIEWDLDLAVSVVRSWLGLMDADGWIAREQVLGPEARSRVPPRSQTHYPHHATPPTMLALVLPALLQKLTRPSSYSGHPSRYHGSAASARALVKELYPPLHRHYLWFRRTQAGDLDAWPRPEGHVPAEGYRWRGRTPKHTLTSGLDDFPRANPPHPGELHVDALAWVGAAARGLMQAATVLGDTSAVRVHREQMEAVQHNLDALHWSEEEQSYCDATVVGHNVTAEFHHVCHQGYVSLFPLLMGLMRADHPRLPAVLDMLSSPQELWSRHGLRSLSPADSGYRRDEDGWRGAVWMNINVLAVQRLRSVGLEDPQKPATGVQERALGLASELRDRVVKTVQRQHERTGFVWEQYDDKTGRGRRSKGFSGWTACVLMLMGLEFERGEAVDTEAVLEQGLRDLSLGRDAGAPETRPVVLLLVLVAMVGLRRKVVGLVAVMAEWWRARTGGGGRIRARAERTTKAWKERYGDEGRKL